MKVKLVKRNGEMKELLLNFSWGYFFFGPLYYLFYKLFWRAFLLILIYVFCIWKDAGTYLVKMLSSLGIDSKYVKFLEIPGDNYLITIGIIIGIHIVLSFISSKIIAKILLQKRGYVAYSEIDAQALVKYSLAKVGTKSFLGNFKSVKGVQGKIKIKNTEDLDKKLEELAQLLKEGMITKDEYNTKRAEALMNVNINK